ncbi:MAG: SDR family NAD(P)-dependent oxidoreductase [Chloroflexota bacterium]|nr:SDR family NAD(P)-dependent oxidoreductase [Chloroflexota bacterium]MDE2909828.1 SDR family NAD(P)-dependent oxidoreductase [Chloroflexota bacterium]
MPKDRTKQKSALVTGAARGLGEGIVRRLAQDGWSIMMTDISPAVHETAARIIGDTGIPAERISAEVHDVSSAERTAELVAAAVDRFGGLDLAVANAGTGGVEVDLVDLNVEDFEHILNVNYRGVFLTCKYAGQVMRAQGSGNIITVSSIFGQEPYPRVAAYSGTKAGVIALTLAFALEMAPHNVRVNTIAPGYMATEMQWEGLRQRAEHAGITFEEERQRVWDLVPLGRHGTAEEMGALVAFLASDDAAYITGVTLGLAGGVVRR